MSEEPRAFGTAVPPTAAPLGGAPTRERAFNAPWVVVAATALLVGVFVWQLNQRQAVIERFALIPIEFSAGRPAGLFGHIVLHGGWIHLFFNSTALLAFGAPVARLFGSSPGGALRFAMFFLLCGVLGGLTFWALHPAGTVPLVGASGAISGLMGAAARLIERRGVVGRPFSPVALRFVMPWIVLNLLLAAAGTAFALPIAWEAHLGGLFAGWLLIGVFAPKRGRVAG
jgi:membrane associated rhomboid family serine protease